MKKRFLFVASCLLAALRAEPVAAPAVAPAPEAEAEIPQFIRVEEKEAATELQTAVVKFTKGEASVELVGAIHIADKKYYEALNNRFEGYEVVLYEGIGGGKPAAAPAVKDAGVDLEEGEKILDERVADLDEFIAEAQAEKPKANLDGLHGAYEAGARWLGLTTR